MRVLLFEIVSSLEKSTNAYLPTYIYFFYGFSYHLTTCIEHLKCLVGRYTIHVRFVPADYLTGLEMLLQPMEWQFLSSKLF